MILRKKAPWAVGLALAGSLVASTASACEVEDWRWYYNAMVKWFHVEGVTTCESGDITVRAYDQIGDGRQFVGVDSGIVRDRTFHMIIHEVQQRPQKPVVEFTIKPE